MATYTEERTQGVRLRQQGAEEDIWAWHDQLEDGENCIAMSFIIYIFITKSYYGDQIEDEIGKTCTQGVEYKFLHGFGGEAWRYSQEH